MGRKSHRDFTIAYQLRQSTHTGTQTETQTHSETQTHTETHWEGSIRTERAGIGSDELEVLSL